jgi:hypothetical protein
MSEKRGTCEVSEASPRKTRLAWLKLNCLKSNPDRLIKRPAPKLTPRDVTACAASGL